jgi:hypothetical protein
MKTKLIAFLMTGTALMLLGACTGQKNNAEADEEAEVHAPMSVPYSDVEHYFLKNGAELPADPKIDTQEQFDSLFGAAAVMGDDDDLPTQVDFENYFVIAVALPPTSQDVDLEDRQLLDDGETLTLEYSVDRDDEFRTFETQPLLLIAVNRHYERDTVVLSEVTDD